MLDAIADTPAGNTDRPSLPTPDRYALMSLEERGAVIAPLTLAEQSAYARQYAEYLNGILSTAGHITVKADPRDCFTHMALAALYWRDMVRRGTLG